MLAWLLLNFINFHSFWVMEIEMFLNTARYNPLPDLMHVVFIFIHIMLFLSVCILLILPGWQKFNEWISVEYIHVLHLHCTIFPPLPCTSHKLIATYTLWLDNLNLACTYNQLKHAQSKWHMVWHVYRCGQTKHMICSVRSPYQCIKARTHRSPPPPFKFDSAFHL